jgi:hypothetical protein
MSSFASVLCSFPLSAIALPSRRCLSAARFSLERWRREHPPE